MIYILFPKAKAIKKLLRFPDYKFNTLRKYRPRMAVRYTYPPGSFRYTISLAHTSLRYLLCPDVPADAFPIFPCNRNRYFLQCRWHQLQVGYVTIPDFPNSLILLQICLTLWGQYSTAWRGVLLDCT